MAETPEDAWGRLQKWLKQTGRVPANTQFNPDGPGKSQPHPIWASIVTALAIFSIVAAAIDHFGHDSHHYAQWFWIVMAGVSLIVALALWLGVLINHYE